MPCRATSFASSTTDQRDRPGGGGLHASATTAASLRASNFFGGLGRGSSLWAAWDRAADNGARLAGPPVERSRLRPPCPASSTPCPGARGSGFAATVESIGAFGQPSSPPAPAVPPASTQPREPLNRLLFRLLHTPL